MALIFGIRYNFLPSNPCNYGFNTTLIDFPMNVIYKGLQRSQIFNVGLASTLTVYMVISVIIML